MADSSEGVSLEEYVRRWGEKLLNQQFADNEQDNALQAADFLFSLVKRIASRGERDDIQAPFREVRDIITEIYEKPDPEKGYRIKLLFQMYQGVFDRLTPAIYAGAKNKDMSICAEELTIMEELRVRFYKLVAGETWKDYPDLRLIALRFMVRFMEEGQALRRKLAESMGLTITEPDNKEKFESTVPAAPRSTLRQVSQKVTSKVQSKVSGPQKDTWENTFEDLVNMPSERMYPLIRILLEHPNMGKMQKPITVTIQPESYTSDSIAVQHVYQDEDNKQDEEEHEKEDVPKIEEKAQEEEQQSEIQPVQEETKEDSESKQEIQAEIQVSEQQLEQQAEEKPTETVPDKVTEEGGEKWQSF
eukprot:TRINITY_DN7381_c0_g1_i1.p1 TRINITY_DN7381_c0_g1~~TRINITY_DN7381_c0_g1_i1.p1  ORF type:complete len:375 (-),score=58.20 TRINITY_DN7381_c0_g1_i1:340-1419(-)